MVKDMTATLERLTIPDTSALPGHVPVSIHEQILDFARKHPDEELRTQSFEREFPELTAGAIRSHLKRLVHQSALIHRGYNRYAVNPSYKTIEQKQVELRRHLKASPLTIVRTENGGSPGASAVVPEGAPPSEAQDTKGLMPRVLHTLQDLQGEYLTVGQLCDLMDVKDRKVQTHVSAILSALYSTGRIKRESVSHTESGDHRVKYRWAYESSQRKPYVPIKTLNTLQNPIPPDADQRLAAVEEEPNLPEPAVSVKQTAWSASDRFFLGSLKARMRGVSQFTEDDIAYLDDIERRMKGE